MYLKILKNDWKKNPGSNLSMLFFMALSGAVTAVSVLMLVQLLSSISSLYEKAQPPHFLQLHKGEIVQEEIDAFNEDYPGITYWQTVPMINIEGTDIFTEGEKNFTLEDCRLDIGFVRQNESHDLLLDENRNRIRLTDGEIGIPVILLNQYPIRLGDKITVRFGEKEKEFTAAEFVRDAQMNSTMCSSTRFLVSDGDFEEFFRNAPEREYIIEAWFEDTAASTAYQTAYEQALLPRNGQAVTYSMIFLLSAITDITTAMVFLLIGILLIFIALLCMKYTMTAAFEEELTEIGTMKAMGIPFTAIRGLYLGKMRILMAAGIFIGYVIAVSGAGFFTSHMSRTFGNQPVSGGAFFFSGAACVLVYFLFKQYCKRILKKLRAVTVLDALVTQKGFKKERRVQDKLHCAKRLPVNLSVGLQALRQNLPEYAVVFLIMSITVFFVLLPQNLVSTMSAKEFVTYMGSSVHDAMIEVEQGEGVKERWNRMTGILQREEGISFWSTRRVRIKALDSEGEVLNLHVDAGNGSGDGLAYLEGEAPKEQDEIALSLLLSEQLGVEEGDTLVLLTEKGRETFAVCGVYQDVTSGGMTAKAACDFVKEETEQYTIYIDMEQGIDKEALVSKWREQAGRGYSVEFMETFVGQTLGGVINQIKNVSFIALSIGLLLIISIILLFMKLRLAGEASQLAYKKALGIPLRDVRLQELYPVYFAAFGGTVVGMAAANTFGDSLAGLFLSFLGLGIKSIHFILSPQTAWLITPMLLFLTSAAAGGLAAGRISKLEAVEYMNE